MASADRAGARDMSIRTQTVKAGVAYFALVFGAGFVFGMVRIPFLVPRLGVRTAELLEMPLMGLVIVMAARFIVRRFALPVSAGVRWGTGLVALAVAVGAELMLAMAVQGQSIAELVASRDAVSGPAFLLMLVLFAAMPMLLARAQARRGT